MKRVGIAQALPTNKDVVCVSCQEVQEVLTSLMDGSKLRSKGLNARERAAYVEAVLAAKSVMSKLMQRQNDRLKGV